MMPTDRHIVTITAAFQENQKCICCVTDDGLPWEYVYYPEKHDDEYGGWDWKPMRPVPQKGVKIG